MPPRVLRHRPAFTDALPFPPSVVLRDATIDDPARIWGGWSRPVDEAARGSARTGGYGGADDPSSLMARIELGGGRVWSSTSVTLLAFGRDAFRYAFSDAPGDSRAWRMVG